MSCHLSPEQISAWALGERAPETLEHVRACSSCLSALEEFDETLAQFRLSVHEAAAEQQPAVWELKPARPRIFWRLSAACATIAIVLATSRLGTVPERHGQDSAAADAALLKQIDSDVSQIVPDSMEPLMRLVAWDRTTAAKASGRGMVSDKTEER